METPSPNRNGGDFALALASHQGLVYRSSSIVETVVNQRYAALVSGHLCTYRREGDAKPSKAWSLRGAAVEPPREVVCEIKSKGTSTVVAIVAGKVKRKLLHGVRISFEGADPLTLYTEAPEDAQAWHAALSAAAADATPAGTPARTPGGGGAAEYQTPSASRPLQRETPSGAAARGSTVPKRKSRGKWAALMHVNGTAVYLEQTDRYGHGGAVMASLVVRAAPAAVFEHLMHVQEWLDSSAETVQVVNGHRSIARIHVQPEGWLSYFSAPRELLVSVTHRVDDEGTYVILYQSVSHDGAPERPPGPLDWRSPIRMHVPAAGITVAPLQRQHTRPDGESPESLLTIVVKANPRGWLGGGLLPALLGPANVQLAVVRPFISAMIATRDRVEQQRFVIQPLEFGGEDGAAADADAEEGEASGGGGGPPTGLTGGRTTLDVLDHNFRTKSLLQARRIHGEFDKMDALAEEAGGGAAMEAAAQGADAVKERVLRAYAQGTCPQRYWSCPGASGFRLRGPNYLQDRKKVDAGLPGFELVAVDLIRTRERSVHVAPQLPSLKYGSSPFTLVFNLQVPGPPHLSLIVSWAADFDPDARESESTAPSSRGGGDDVSDDEAAALSPVDCALARFLAGDDATRNDYLKLIPKIIQASWIIKQAVGSTPVILGKKLTTSYHKGALDGGARRYMEVDVDIGSSSAASSVVGLVQPATKSLVLDIAVLLEGGRADELPEGLLGAVRLSNLDLSEFRYLDADSGMVYGREDAPPEVLAWP